MPRRPSKANRATKGSKPRPVDRSASKIKKWNKASDVPLDNEDEFHASRDEILLDGNRQEYQDVEDEEVFALNGLEEDDDEDEEDDYDDEEDPEPVPAAKSKSKTKDGKKKPRGPSPTPSAATESEEEEESWGKGRGAYYASNAADIESDDEEANALEEAEAIRLQAKTRNALVEDDFGLEDDIPGQIDREGDASFDVQVDSELGGGMDGISTLKQLEKRDPESIALARDWADTVENLSRTKERLATLEAEESNALSLGMVHIYYQALLSYTTSLAFYLYLRAHEKYARKPELLKSHPIIERLLTLKQSLTTLEDLDFTLDSEDEDLDNGDLLMQDALSLWDSQGPIRPGAVDDDDDAGEDNLDDIEAKLDWILASAQGPEPKKKKKRSAVEKESRPKKKRKISAESDAPSLPEFDLVEPDFKPSSKKKSERSALGVVTSDSYGEATALDQTDATSKSHNRKSLRFHTAKITSAAARRQGARNAVVGGDDDIPYKERAKEKEKKALMDAKARLEKQGGADLDDVEPEARAKDDSDGDNDMDVDGDGYYELVKRSSKAKKETKKAEYEAATAPQYEEDIQGEGPRGITRAILANKGLTPQRSKSVRNPRVKKRMKFEKAKKKISSQKAVYKGGLGSSGHYGGETSGISKVVKSIKLS